MLFKFRIPRLISFRLSFRTFEDIELDAVDMAALGVLTSSAWFAVVVFKAEVSRLAL